MRSPILKHCAGRSYNSPLKQKSMEANLEVDKERQSLSPYLSASSGNFNVKAGGTLTREGGNFNTGLNYNKNGFSAGVGLSGATGEKPNVTANIGYKKVFK